VPPFRLEFSHNQLPPAFLPLHYLRNAACNTSFWQLGELLLLLLSSNSLSQRTFTKSSLPLVESIYSPNLNPQMRKLHNPPPTTTSTTSPDRYQPHKAYRNTNLTSPRLDVAQRMVGFGWTRCRRDNPLPRPSPSPMRTTKSSAHCATRMAPVVVSGALV
jgi:hypothetical protein